MEPALGDIWNDIKYIAESYINAFVALAVSTHVPLSIVQYLDLSRMSLTSCYFTWAECENSYSLRYQCQDRRRKIATDWTGCIKISFLLSDLYHLMRRSIVYLLLMSTLILYHVIPFRRLLNQSKSQQEIVYLCWLLQDVYSRKRYCSDTDY